MEEKRRVEDERGSRKRPRVVVEEVEVVVILVIESTLLCNQDLRIGQN